MVASQIQEPSHTTSTPVEPRTSTSSGSLAKAETNNAETPSGVPQDLLNTVLKQSGTLTTPTIKGYDFNEGIDYERLLGSYLRSGYQAQNFGKAVMEIERMLEWSLAMEETAVDEEPEFKEKSVRDKFRTKIFLGFTSNLVSSGLRETLRFLVQRQMVQVVCASAGGVEEDLIKCLAPTHMGEFTLDGRSLRAQGLNRIANLIVPNKNYCLFEDWIGPLIHKMHDIQEKDGIIWSPSQMIHFLGKEINNEESICYWAYKNNIPVFCPAITDGSLGDMIYFHSYNRAGFIIDIAKDIRLINDEARTARKTGCIIVGGGVIKHHIMNANLMRNGTDFCVYLSTAQEFDGCDSGANPDEAKSWGKIRVDANPVKIYGEATMIFPLLVAQTFAKRFYKMGEKQWMEDRENAVFNKSYTPSESEVEKNKLGAATPQLEL